MPVEKRALLIGLIGPAIQSVGLVVEVAHIAASHLDSPLTPRHIAFEPGFLLILVGFLISFVCIPVAVDVARSRAEDVAIPVFGPAAEAESRKAFEAAD
jgi:hypothetical protein